MRASYGETLLVQLASFIIELEHDRVTRNSKYNRMIDPLYASCHVKGNEICTLLRAPRIACNSEYCEFMTGVLVLESLTSLTCATLCDTVTSFSSVTEQSQQSQLPATEKIILIIRNNFLLATYVVFETINLVF